MLVARKYSTVNSRLNYLSFFFFFSKSFCQKSLHDLLSEQCSSMKHLKQIHAHIIIHALTGQTLTLGKLISFCAVSGCGDLRHAQLVFDTVPEPNRFMYNTLIRAYSDANLPQRALSLYRTMVNCSCLSPNEFTFPFVLKACALQSSYRLAISVHCQVVKHGLGSHICVQNALINAYVSYELTSAARQVFDEMPDRTLVSWNTMISGCSCTDAFSLFREMRDLGVGPDKFTLANLLSVCSRSGDVNSGRCLHAYMELSGVDIDGIVSNSLLDMYAKCGNLRCAKTVFDRMSWDQRNVVSWTSMVNAYARNGFLDSARAVFHSMPSRNVVSWNAMISGYARESCHREALDLFGEMRDCGTAPDEATLVCVLSSCAQIGDLAAGREAHNYAIAKGWNLGTALTNSLIDMYAKCGELGTAQSIFLEAPRRNVVTWNTMIGGLASHGRGLEAVGKFEEMIAAGFQADSFTFTALLSACSHSGLVDAGRGYFRQMREVFGIQPEMEHYACMIDLLARGGHLGEAIGIVGEMGMRPDIVIWGALLGGCRAAGNNVEVGKQILKQVLELERGSSGLFVLLSNIFSEVQRWGDVERLRKVMRGGGVVKSRGVSFIQIHGFVSEFVADDTSHHSSAAIYDMLYQLTDHVINLNTHNSLQISLLD